MCVCVCVISHLSPGDKQVTTTTDLGERDGLITSIEEVVPVILALVLANSRVMLVVLYSFCCVMPDMMLECS